MRGNGKLIYNNEYYCKRLQFNNLLCLHTFLLDSSHRPRFGLAKRREIAPFFGIKIRTVAKTVWESHGQLLVRDDPSGTTGKLCYTIQWCAPSP